MGNQIKTVQRFCNEIRESQEDLVERKYNFANMKRAGILGFFSILEDVNSLPFKKMKSKWRFFSKEINCQRKSWKHSKSTVKSTKTSDHFPEVKFQKVIVWKLIFLHILMRHDKNFKTSLFRKLVHSLEFFWSMLSTKTSDRNWARTRKRSRQFELHVELLRETKWIRQIRKNNVQRRT